LQVGEHQFIGLDDDVYVTGNPHVATGVSLPNVVWAFTSVEAANWHPVTWLSHMADAQVFGLNPCGHHLSNVVIHIATSLALLLLLLRCTGSLWQSALVAYLFALHPLHVESVAWVAERKDVLSALFWMLTLLAYCEYLARRKRSWYLLALGFFVLGLMAKPMLVTLPVVLLLLDFWPLDRLRQERPGQEAGTLAARVGCLVREKIPFFACALLSAVITIYAQHKGGATKSLDAVPLLLRLENALVAYLRYLLKTIWPHDLAVLYPVSVSLPLWQAAGSLLVLALITTFAVRHRRRFPFVAVGWFWYLVTLLPVIGLIQVGNQSMADRYSYLPLIGIFMVLAWGIPSLLQGVRHRERILAPLAAVAVLASAALTWHQLGYWRDSVSLFRHTLEVTRDNYLITNNLGVALSAQGAGDEGIRLYREALRINPVYLEAHNNLAVALFEKGDLEGALRESREALRLNPGDAISHYNLGRLLARVGDLAGALREFQEALRIKPDDVNTLINLGAALAGTGNLDAAIRQYQAALRLSRDSKDAHYNLGVALANQGNLDAAIGEFREVLRISPDDREAQSILGQAIAQRRLKGGGGKAGTTTGP
jgi:protein O-mannosyl-transferase